MMSENEPISSITAFATAQAEMGTAFKNAKNPFLKNKYADLTTIQNAVYPAFHANGFAILQVSGKDEFGAFVETQFIHISGDEFSGKVYLEYKANDMQSLGGAITYARRYGLASISGVPIEDDDGNAATGRDKPKATQAAPQEVSNPPSNPVSPVHRGVRLIKFLDSFEVTEEKLRKIADDADEVVRLVKLEDPEFAQKIEFALENKKSELGII
jgi:hypothetical protein